MFEDRIVVWTLADARACPRITEDKRRRDEALAMVWPGRSIAVANACPVPPVRDSTVEA